ncbi:MAG: transglutaminase-like domain-containing protein [Lachnospiraceae bacterium]|nr:transglutaminase-like domain-containing protein [Lachnospiraceae bacterium]
MDTNNEVAQSKKNVSIIILVCLSILIAIASLVVVIISFNANAKANKKTARFIDDQLERQAEQEEKENEYVEDGFMVMDQYEIRSTTHISDAYISGDDSSLSAEDKETLDLAKKVIDKVIKPDMTDFEKEFAIYKWIKTNIGHGTSTVVALPNAEGNDFTPGGVLRTRNAVCVGYATTFRMFMQMFGMECHIVHNESHSWDLLKLDDGEWYHIDIYSDAGTSGYKNFNMSDSICRAGHEWDASSLPEAKGTKYTLAVQKNKKIKNIYAVPKYIKKAIDKKDYSLYFSFEEKLKEEDLPVADVLITQITSALAMNGMDSYWITGAWVDDKDTGYILSVFIEDYNATEAPATNISGEKGRKMTNAVNEAFGTALEYDAQEVVGEEIVPEGIEGAGEEVEEN